MNHRKVFQVAAWYGASAWLLIQVASTTFPVMDLPMWAVRAVIVTCLAGFPIALLLAWSFGLRSEGSLPQVAGECTMTGAGPAHRFGYALWLALAAGVLFGVGAIQGWRAFTEREVGDRPGIAILPFESLGGDGTFADAVHEAILTQVAKVGGLKVIARTSVLHYRTGPPDIRTIALELGVRYVLEGSVQRLADRLRITAQLIDTDTNDHVWAEEYDRTVNDLFAVQSEVARTIATQLRVQLAPEERTDIRREPTTNPEAYAAYLRALVNDHAFFQKKDEASMSIHQHAAENAYVDAVKLDPTFALAMARHAMFYSRILLPYEEGSAEEEGYRGQIKALVDEALRLEPELPEAHQAYGAYLARIGKLDAALNEFDRAREASPNDAVLLTMISRTLATQWRWADALEPAQTSVELDPLNDSGFELLAIILQALHNYADAYHAANRAQIINPDNMFYPLRRAALALDWKGSTQELRAQFKPGTVLGDAPGANSWLAWLALMDRNPSEALRLLATIEENEVINHPKSVLEALTHEMAGRTADARRCYEAARQELELEIPEHASSTERATYIWNVQTNLGFVYAALSRREEALGEVRQVFDHEQAGYSSQSLTALEWSFTFPEADAQAFTLARAGDVDEALRLFEELMVVPGGTSAHMIRLDPRVGTLADDPRFKALIAKYLPK